MNKVSKILLISVLTMLGLAACEKYLSLDMPDWTDSTHGSATKQYQTLFNGKQILTLEFDIEGKHWDYLIENTSRLNGDFGNANSNAGGPPPNNNTQEMIVLSSPSPDYIPCNLTCNGVHWYKVGFRFKGNSSLRDSWTQGIMKVPLRLDFNKFGNIYEGIEEQHFYGFEEMTFASNFKDASQIKETIAYELMKAFGIPVPETNFAEIYINYGEGKQYFGLYTMIEPIEDYVRNSNGQSEGSLFKPSSMSATLQKDEIIAYELDQKTNFGNGINEIETFVDILHNESRTSSPEYWRSQLESVFEVDLFLKFLAANTTMQNWDSYGKSSQNYYLYLKSDGKIEFIPWDLSETFELNSQIAPIKIDLSDVSDQWPLIKFLMADPVYSVNYKTHVLSFNEQIFVPSVVNSRIDELFELIRASVIKEQSGYTHNNNLNSILTYINGLKNQIEQRHNTVKNFYQ